MMQYDVKNEWKRALLDAANDAEREAAWYEYCGTLLRRTTDCGEGLNDAERVAARYRRNAAALRRAARANHRENG